jgi:hypothetical protein
VKDVARLIVAVLLLTVLGADTGLHIVGMLVCSTDREVQQNDGSAAIGQLPPNLGSNAISVRLSDKGERHGWCSNAVQKQQSVDERMIGLFTDLKFSDILLAIFTGMLVLVGRRQANISDRQREIIDRQAGVAEHQAKITHTQLMLAYRPKVIVRNIEMLVFNPEMPIAIRYTFVNTGETDAKVVEWSVGHTVVPPGANFSDRIPFPRPIPPRRPTSLVSGNIIQEDFTDIGPFGDNCALVKDAKIVLLFFEVIAYRDGMGRVKRTGFARRFDPETRRFHLTDDPDNEYQD